MAYSSLNSGGLDNGRNELALVHIRHVTANLDHFFQARKPFANLAKTVVPQRDHAVGGGNSTQVGHALSGNDGIAKLVVDEQELMDAQPPAIARVAALAAADAFVKLFNV